MSEMIASLAAAVEWIFAQVVMEVMFLSSVKLRVNELEDNSARADFQSARFYFQYDKIKSPGRENLH